METKEILIFLYSITWIVWFLAFLPTIIDLIKWKPSANLNTYILWSIITLFSFMYGLFVLKDYMFNLVIWSQLFWYLIITILSIRLKYIKK